MKRLLTYGVLLLGIATYSQNLDQLGTKNAVKVSGGVNFNTIAYAQKGLITPSREPFTWFASGNVNISVLDVAFPFTYSLSNQGGKFTQPYNRTALHPQYKWMKSHIGIFSMNFSPYTLQGHLILGGGVELTPGDWDIQLVGGRLKKEVQYDPISENINDITYRRWGYGFKVGYEKKGFGGEFIAFKSNDQQSSLSTIPINSEIKPQDNIVFSVKGKAPITKQLKVEAEYAISGLTQNQNEINDINPAMQHIFHKIVNGNATTDFFNAVKTSLNYASKKFNLAFNFEHIDPGYRTLGGYYFNHDMQNYTLAPSFSLFKKKVNVGINTGFQRNNLSDTESSTSNRWIGNINVAIVPGKKMAINANYSNFSNFTRNRPALDPFYYQPADTLNFYQLTQNAALMVSYNIGEGDLKSSIQAMYNYQESTSMSGNIAVGGPFGIGVSSNAVGIPTQVHLGNLAYSANFTKAGAAITVAANMNRTEVLDQTSLFFGPSLNLQKSILGKKGSLSAGTTYNRQYMNASLTSNILSHRITFGFNPKLKNEKIGKVGLSANATFLQRFAVASNQANINELNLFLNLNYSF